MGVRAHGRLAAWAAATASSTSAASPSGIWAMTDSSPGWTTGMVAPDLAATRSGPMGMNHGRSA
jgi:hypothetical protein